MDKMEEQPIIDLPILHFLIKRAWETGEYPEWNFKEDEDGDTIVDTNMRPTPFVDAEGKILNMAAYKRAVQRIGFHVVNNATWMMPHFNCIIQVEFIVIYCVELR